MQETDAGDAGLIPRLERIPGGVYGKPLQYFCLENPMDREEPGMLQSIGSQSDMTERMSTHTHTQSHCTYFDS